ncbi:MAG: 2-oxoacid:ferredoxin oxidoreductase subunit beta [Gammaproteobacteria bacterium]
MLTKKDFESDQEVRWCPGCGDYAILSSVQKILADLQRQPENTVFISGIGCSSRFPYYMNTYGFHTIHGRAPTFATGLKLMRPELDVWIVTGDGDGLSIGANHLIHLMRRNVNVTVLLCNNRIYGLTKGQISPTSEIEKVTKTTPKGSIDQPLDPISLALSVGCTFVARAIDIDTQGIQSVLKRAALHEGTSFVEIYQNCNVFNDGAFNSFADRVVRDARTIRFDPQDLDAPKEDELMKRLASPDIFPVPIGIFRESKRPTHDGLAASKNNGASPIERKQLQAFLEKGQTWEI